MSTSHHVPSSRRRLSLTARFSALLVLAVVLPLFITAVGSELLLRPTLLSQAEAEMGNDAQAHAQAIDALFIARLQDIGYLKQFFAIQKYLTGDEMFKQQAQNELALGYGLDSNYSAWALFNAQGNKLRLSYPTDTGPRGKYVIPPDIMDQLNQSSKATPSDVYYDDNTHMAFVDIYAPITSQNNKRLGIARSTLKLSAIWTAVNNETNAAPGSFAMLLDDNGVRIAYTNTDTTLTTLPQPLFKSIGPLQENFKQRINDENLYGNNHRPVTELSDPTLVANQEAHGLTTFQLTPALQQEPFRAYRVTCHAVPWTYIVLRPVDTITGPANQQDIYLLLIAAVISLLAAVVGILVGRSVTRPILQSVSSLLASSQMLKTLAAREQATATEQKWIVESSQVGMKSVQYYTEAASVASRKLDEMSTELAQQWGRFDIQRTQQRLAEIISTANYIEKAVSHQEKSSKSLSTAIRITTQVTEQLISGATSASDAATQLESVIEQLRQVVGK